MHESYSYTSDVFPHQFPKRSLKTEQIMFAGILKYCNSVYLSGSRAVRSAVMHALQMTVSARRERRKGNPHRKYTIKDTMFNYYLENWDS